MKRAKLRPIKLSDIWAVFFPADFHQQYRYLGAVPWNTESDIFKAMEPLVIFMDYKARSWWCPKWFLRFLHLFGNDNSIVRVRNLRLHNLHRKITKGIFIWDYKTKWHWYDLRIHVTGDDQIANLAMDIENRFYSKGYRKDIIESIQKIEPDFNKTWMINHELGEYYNKLKDKSNE
jgi:hypothetical protein